MGLIIILGSMIVLALLWAAGEGDPRAILLLIWIVSLVAAYFVIKKRAKYAYTLYRPWVGKLWDKVPLTRLIFGYPRFWLMVCTVVMTGRVINAALAVMYVNLTAEAAVQWGLALVGIIVIVAIYYAVFDMALIKMLVHYKNTEYCRKTGYTRSQVLNEKSLWGEFLAFAYCDRVAGHKRILLNAIVPKFGTDKDFAEIDMICICKSGIHVIEAKNRGGTLQGNTWEPNWKQLIGKQENDVYNPILQNQNHIIALARYLWGPFQTDSNCLEWSEQIKEHLFFNHVFIADPTCQVNESGALPAGTVISWNSYLTKEIDGTAEYVDEYNWLSDEEINYFADLLEGTTNYTSQQRADLIASRANWKATSGKETSFYFVQLSEDVQKRVQLFRFNSLGVAKFEDGFWFAAGMSEIGAWKDRLPYCMKDYSDITSFSKAREVADALQRMVDNPYYGDLIAKHMKEHTLEAYLKNTLPYPGICYLEGDAHMKASAERITHPECPSVETSEVDQLPEFKPDEKERAFFPADEEAAAKTGKFPKVFGIEKFPDSMEVSPVSGLTPGQEKYAMLLKLAEQENPEAIKAIGDCWLNGNLGEANKWDNATTNYRFAASRGVVSAQNNLGVVLLLSGRENAEEAILSFTLAAEQGNRMAQYNLGAVYDEGIFVGRDFWKARYWMERAGEQNQVYACQWLASLYETGQDVPADPEKAAYWHRMAEIDR